MSWPTPLRLTPALLCALAACGHDPAPHPTPKPLASLALLQATPLPSPRLVLDPPAAVLALITSAVATSAPGRTRVAGPLTLLSWADNPARYVFRCTCWTALPGTAWFERAFLTGEFDLNTRHLEITSLVPPIAGFPIERWDTTVTVRTPGPGPSI